MKNYTIYVNGTPYNVSVQEGGAAPVAPVAPVAAAPSPAAASAPAAPAVEEAPAPAPAAPQGAAGSIKVDAPMPGNILNFFFIIQSPIYCVLYLWHLRLPQGHWLHFEV